MREEEARNRTNPARPILFGVGFIFMVVALATTNTEGLGYAVVILLTLSGVTAIVASVFWPNGEEDR